VSYKFSFVKNKILIYTKLNICNYSDFFLWHDFFYWWGGTKSLGNAATCMSYNMGLSWESALYFLIS
jgi:hypothetical protein